jgi:hypothetical protein
MNARGKGGGGHATAGGVQFQVKVAASLAVGMLAEAEYEPRWGWPREVTFFSRPDRRSAPISPLAASTRAEAVVVRMGLE